MVEQILCGFVKAVSEFAELLVVGGEFVFDVFLGVVGLHVEQVIDVAWSAR